VRARKRSRGEREVGYEKSIETLSEGKREQERRGKIGE
jgi:hypothetical protein